MLLELAALFPARRAVVARELTKLHEELVRGTLEEVAAIFAAREVVGEIVVLLEGVRPDARVDDDVVLRALHEQWDEGATTRDAVDYVAETLGVSRRDVYQLALEARKES